MKSELLKNHIKEVFLIYVLDILYNKLSLSDIKLYGGASMRTNFSLNRKIVDFDFQTQKSLPIKEILFQVHQKLQNRLGLNLEYKYILGMNENFHTLFISSEVGSFKIDINYYDNDVVLPTAVVNKSLFELNVPIHTYTPSVLMSGKICSLYFRTMEQVKDTYKDLPNNEIEKIFWAKRYKDSLDLLWFMNTKVIPYEPYLLSRKVSYVTLDDLLDFLYEKVSYLKSSSFEDKNFLFDKSLDSYISSKELDDIFTKYNEK